MSNIFLSRALQSAGTPIVNALGYRAAEQRQFTQMRNALLAEQQAQEAREQNALAELANLNVAAQGLPEATNQLNALIAGSATGQVNPNDVGKAAAQIAKINQELPQRANALMAEIQDAREKKAYLENDPFTRGIMSGDIKTMNALSGAALVKYPVKKPKEEKWSLETYTGLDEKGNRVTNVVLMEEKSGAIKPFDTLRGKELETGTIKIGSTSLSGKDYQDAFNQAWKNVVGTMDFFAGTVPKDIEANIKTRMTELPKDATYQQRREIFERELLELGYKTDKLLAVIDALAHVQAMSSLRLNTTAPREYEQAKRALAEAKQAYAEEVAARKAAEKELTETKSKVGVTRGIGLGEIPEEESELLNRVPRAQREQIENALRNLK